MKFPGWPAKCVIRWFLAQWQSIEDLQSFVWIIKVAKLPHCSPKKKKKIHFKCKFFKLQLVCIPWCHLNGFILGPYRMKICKFCPILPTIEGNHNNEETFQGYQNQTAFPTKCNWFFDGHCLNSWLLLNLFFLRVWQKVNEEITL